MVAFANALSLILAIQFRRGYVAPLTLEWDWGRRKFQNMGIPMAMDQMMEQWWNYHFFTHTQPVLISHYHTLPWQEETILGWIIQGSIVLEIEKLD